MKFLRLLKIFSIITLIAIFSTSGLLFARAGGGGGHSGGGHGGGFSGGSHSFGGFSGSHVYIPSGSGSGRSSPGVVTIVIIIIIIIIVANMAKNKAAGGTAFSKMADHEKKDIEDVPGYKEFMTGNSGFDIEEFKNKVRKAFLEVQTAWSEQDTNRMRRFISDGVYQRFNTQFKMMKLLQQTNPVSNIEINDVWVDKIEQDGSYDIMQVGIDAKMDDKFVCNLNHDLDEEGSDEFVEFWSFIRRRGATKKDIYDSDKCPNCSAPLPADLGEVGKCKHCNAMVNSGEFDWILSEITQEDDYHSDEAFSGKAGNLEDKVYDMTSVYGDFAVQLVEDKASNAYLQILTAQATHNPSLMRRFVSDEFFEKIRPRIENNREIFNRIFLNRVTLVGARREGEKNVLMISLICSYQRAVIEGGKAELIDPEIMTKEEVLFLAREAQVGAGKGSVYQHSCSACGGPIKDTLELKCSYCGNLLNSTVNDWIVTALMDRTEFDEYFQANQKFFTAKVDPQSLDKLYSVKDYALNNIMIIFAADGVFDDEEREFLGDAARKWGFKSSDIEPLFKMAASGRLSIRMPEDRAMRASIYELMQKAAMADENIAPQEQKILDWVKANFIDK